MSEPRYWMTQSLLSSYLYYLNCEDEKADAAYESLLKTIRRVETPATQAMLDGQRFEDCINKTVAGETVDTPEKWQRAVKQFANICNGGASQTPLAGELKVFNLHFVLYGIADYVKAGQIYDIKKTGIYTYDKYFCSPQHPMYFHLLPEAQVFTYLVFDGQRTYKERYFRDDCPRKIEDIIADFICFLDRNNLLCEYKENWKMNDERNEKIYGIYERT